jgi:hypothetical protein
MVLIDCCVARLLAAPPVYDAMIPIIVHYEPRTAIRHHNKAALSLCISRGWQDTAPGLSTIGHVIRRRSHWREEFDQGLI